MWIFLTGKFRKFDYTLSFLNIEKYGQSVPPNYKLENVNVPMAIFYADNDLLADYRVIYLFIYLLLFLFWVIEVSIV